MSFPIEKADTAELIRHQRLVLADNLFRLLHMQFPKEACQQIEESAGGIDTYLMGLISKGRIVGDVGISVQSGTILPNRDLIEAFIRQAAIAIDRKNADDSLLQSLIREQEQVRNLQFLSRTAMDFIKMGDSADIHRYIGDRLHELAPESIASVYSFDLARRETVLRAVSGDREQIERLWDALGANLLGLPCPVDQMPASGIDLSAKRVVESPSLHRSLFHQVPEDRCILAETLLGLGKGYIMGFSCRKGILGHILIQLTREGEITNRGAVEAFANQAGVALARRQTEDRLRRSESRFRDVVDSSPFPAVIIEGDGTYSFVNRRFTEMFGYTLEDIPTGREWFRRAFPDPEIRHEAIATWKADRERAGRGTPRPRTFSVRCKNGEEKAILFNPVELGDGTQYVTCEDITEERRAYWVLIDEIAELRRQLASQTL
ncbi:sensory box histidine kinase/response regulator [hydrocarbon metagenome]|uniref:Sensory box histidine kinase/response regulator n=1 Tax=hydrocarbon metagenome TaxID=938273 RepID=A0A0W8FIP0_9ZZZZ|nr:PAS domain S-box protein [Methanomicrobiaceae archaeon]